MTTLMIPKIPNTQDSTIFFDLANVPEKHWRAKLSHIPDDLPHKSLVQTYINNLPQNIKEGRGLLLFGPLGQGKSALASIILKAAFHHKKLGYYLTASSYMGHLKDPTYFDQDKTIVDHIKTNPLLVIDEFILYPTLGEREFCLEDLFRYRVAHNKATIITTNHTPQELKKRYPAFHSVLTEAVLPINVIGYNFREKIFEKNVKEFL